ncbi:testis-expressed protein 2 isoform X2 [Chrysoperla carnea]|uniref:testis-expressed protein 2 isoform X2 n=1 Tax=Chrysoperla carnea TaxID=189513 RepID=UPI001D078332|nr:testis-expressed protein 2 isoform X2 [Chrysoperla carnea]
MDTKGKSANTSVPSIAIRFHANEEELEQLYLSDSDVEKEYSPVIEDLKSDDLKSDKKGSPKRESSPMKDVFSKLSSKRSASVDSNIPIGEQASSSTDRWRLFSEIKGKLTKTVEEKISEIKSGTKCPEQERTSEDTETIRNKFSTSKDNSSVSDSEDVSVSEHSTSKFADVEMSSTNETEDEIEVSFPNKDPISKDVDDQLFNDEIIISIPKKETVKHRFKKSSTPHMNVQYKTKENRDSYIETATEAFINEAPNDGDDSTPSESIEKQIYVTKLHPKNISNDWFILSIFILLLSLIFTITSVPNYLAVFLTGFLFLIYTKFTSNTEDDSKSILFMAKKMETLNRVQTPSIKTYEPVLKYEAWMNEYPVRYDVNTYHIGDTHSVYVRLYGSKLILSVGDGIRVPKRAMWNESAMPHLHLIKFTRHRVFNMIGAKVRLLPQGLARKRYWSKKYPICLEFTKVGKEYNKLPPEEETFDTSSHDSPTKKRSISTEKLATDESLIENFLEQSVEQSAKVIEPPENEQTIFSTPDGGGDDGDLTDDAEETSIEWDTVGDVLDDITRIYLFTRTDRDKEDWFNYFVAATQSSSIPPEPLIDTIEKSKETENQSDNSAKSSPSHTASAPKLDDEQLTYNFDYQQFVKKMQHHKKNYENAPEQAVNEISSKVLWFNALLGRVLLDAVRQQDWVETLQQRIQRKLSVIKLPYFIEELVITELNLGTSVPIIHKISEPTFDSRGVWVDFDITYEGSVHGTLVTKLNLMKLKKPPAGQEVAETEKMAGDNNIPGPVYDSDLDDSAESSSEEDIIIPSNWIASNTSSSSGVQSTSSTPTSAGSSGNTAGKRLLKMVDKIAASKYFQQATDYKLIKKAMEGVSKTELKLRVELRGLVGVLTVNIPPPPSHRIWIGFRGNPQLWLNARPIVGERSLNFNHITSWIENKLQQEFQKILVLPNMEDFVIPIMNLNLPE